MLHFLENHDEQRIASLEFAGNPEKGMPAMVVSATSTTSPTMIYFGQEVGEDGSEDAGFGSPTRTSIFDYIGVPAHQRWMNRGAFDGGQLSQDEKSLRYFYKRLLNFTIESDAMVGAYEDIHSYNRQNTDGYTDKIFSFVRWSEKEQLVIISNFDDIGVYEFELKIPSKVFEKWGLSEGSYPLEDALYNVYKTNMEINDGLGLISINLRPLESFILKIK